MGINVAEWNLVGQTVRSHSSKGRSGAGAAPSYSRARAVLSKPDAARLPKLSRAVKSKASGSGRTYTSRYRGVHQTFPTRRWEAQFRRNGKPTSLGCFDQESEAAKAYDKMMLWCEIHQSSGVKGGITNFDATEYERELPWLQNISQDELIDTLRAEGRRQAAARMMRNKRDVPGGGKASMNSDTDSETASDLDPDLDPPSGPYRARAALSHALHSPVPDLHMQSPTCASPGAMGGPFAGLHLPMLGGTGAAAQLVMRQQLAQLHGSMGLGLGLPPLPPLHMSMSMSMSLPQGSLGAAPGGGVMEHVHAPGQESLVLPSPPPLVLPSGMDLPGG